MAREILFKAKRIENGEWAEGYYVCLNEKFHYIAVGKLDITEGYPALVLISINPNTLCQYTGLTDKNGNKIWENDILQGHGNPKDLVKIVYGKFYVIDVETLEKIDEVIGWHTEVIPTDEISKREPFCLPMPLTDFYIDRSEFEVINNIFDNPELVDNKVIAWQPLPEPYNPESEG